MQVSSTFGLLLVASPSSQLSFPDSNRSFDQPSVNRRIHRKPLRFANPISSPPSSWHTVDSNWIEYQITIRSDMEPHEIFVILDSQRRKGLIAMPTKEVNRYQQVGSHDERPDNVADRSDRNGREHKMPNVARRESSSFGHSVRDPRGQQRATEVRHCMQGSRCSPVPSLVCVRERDEAENYECDRRYGGRRGCKRAESVAGDAR